MAVPQKFRRKLPHESAVPLQDIYPEEELKEGSLE